ncbi:MAG: endonuclease/exonuclease/phosphatase family protein [Cyanobacteria bacterium J06638_7]
MKIANWNIEWMNKWFSSDGQDPTWRDSSDIPGVTDINDLARRVAAVIKTMDPDILMIQEGPSRSQELKLFVDRYLDGDYTILGPSGKGQQKLYALVKRDGEVQSAKLAYSTGEIDLEETWSVDIDGVIAQGRFTLEEYEFTRVPLMIDVSDGTRVVRIINIHLKSKYLHQGKRLWANTVTRPAFIVDAVRVRRRISAEAMRIHHFIHELLSADEGRSVILCGDFNDGPGTDFFELHYLTHNLVAAASGNPFQPQTMLRHGFVDRMAKEENYTAVFNDYIDNISSRKVLLDHILVSPGLFWDLSDGLIDHTAYAAGTDPAKPGEREKHASDHIPQWITY